MSTATNTAEKVDPALVAEVRRHAEGWLPGGAERFARMVALHPKARHAGPTALAELVAEEAERLGEKYRDPDAPPPSSKSALRRYIRAMEADGTLMPEAAERLYAAVAIDQQDRPLAAQVRAVLDLLKRPEGNSFLAIHRRHGPPVEVQKVRSLLRHFPEEPLDRRDKLAEQHKDIGRLSLSEAEAIRTLAFRLNLPESDGRHRAVASGDRIKYGPNGPEAAAAWEASRPPTDDEARAIRGF